jgi:asparagine synthase (glutamine-hydrolysing)
MCGLAGWFGRSPAVGPGMQARAERMLEAIRHRGPDGDGKAFPGNSALVHARLSIIDLAHGGQPMQSRNTGVVMVFNGEIYNYRELRQRLLASGVELQTHSDSEVVLEWYGRQGVAGFADLRGMYAVALWDPRDESGVLVRDPAGIKPLFVTESDNEILFASEAKAILAADAARPELDPVALHLLLNFRYLPGEHSLMRGVRQLAPGEVLQWRADGIRRSQISTRVEPPASILEGLRDSVRHHLIADVEVGAYLSGGIDSALVVALARDAAPIRTFTVDIGDDPAEAANARETAALLGVPNQSLQLGADLAGRLMSLLWHLETPKVNAVQIALLAEATSREVKVALSGLGGDEVFLGYRWHQWFASLADGGSLLSQLPLAPLAGAMAALLRRRNPVWSEPERACHVVAGLGDWPRLYGLLRNLWDSPAMRRQISGPRLLDAALPDAFDVLRSHWPAQRDPVMAAVAFEQRHKLVNDLLWNEDRCSMAVGLEVRTPFVDAVVQASVAGLSRAELMPRRRPKGRLREALKPLLPEAILRRPKSGFQLDAGQFFHLHLRELAAEWLSPARVKEAGLFAPEFVRSALALPPVKAHRWHYFMLFMMLSTHLWLAVQSDPDPVRYRWKQQ